MAKLHAMSVRPTLLELNQARLIRGGAEVLRGLSLRIESGAHTAIIGPNGAGKSSLVRLIHRDDYPQLNTDGSAPIRLLERERWNVFDLRRQLGIVSGDLQQRFVAADLVTALEAVMSGFFASQVLSFQHAITPAMRDAAMTALTRLDVANLATRRFATLSTGEARRVLIARAIVHAPGALLLDEPTTGLDFVAQHRLLENLARLARGGTTLILVTHHLEEIVPQIEHVILLRDGRVFASGTKSQMLRDDVLSEVYGTAISVQEHAGYYRATVSE